ncbi:MAG: acyl-CoA/acyl-ACP dehydrogenase [Bradymonadales bacterium]|nr:acyl-CoA/acyl-ACP dehydrogenase [Bradymonadales bacterium]
MAADDSTLKEVELTAARFAARHIEPVAAESDSGSPRFDAGVFAAGLEAGFDRFLLPESLGGCGFSPADFCALIRTLAASCAGYAMVFGAHAAGLAALATVLGEAAGGTIERIADSKRPLTLALGEVADGSTLDPWFQVRRKGEKRIAISGQSSTAINAAGGFVLLFARDEKKQPVAVLVDGQKEIVGLGEPEKTLGCRAMPMAALALLEHEEPADRLLAEGDAALRLHTCLLRLIALAAAAAAAGVMTAASRQALAYAAERYQGGKTIIDHTHLRDILGAMSASVAAAQGAVCHASTRPDDDLSALGTKVAVTEAAVRLCTDAVQIFGGYGYMRDYGVEKRMRDAAVLALLPISNLQAHQLIAARERERFSGGDAASAFP